MRIGFLCGIISSGAGLLASCGDGGSQRAELVVTAYGEDFIEQGIPADEMDDGWSVQFERFDAQIGEVNVADRRVEIDDEVDLTRTSEGTGTELARLQVPTGDYMDVAYELGPFHVQGRASKGGVTKTFDWELGAVTRYSECETTTEVRADASAVFEITVHADHLFYDSLVAEDPQLLFQSLADADTDGDGEITRRELADADIGAYDPGSEDGLDDLWSYLAAQSRTLGHVDGEGHCQVSDD